MFEYLVVRLSDGVVSTTAVVRWMLLNLQGEEREVRHGSLQEAGDYYASLTRKPVVVVLAPAREVLLTAVDIPIGQQRYAKQALPFLVEEKLADDIEDVHIAMGPVHKNQPVPVAVARHFDVINWLDALYSVGLPTNWMVPEQLALPWHEGRIRVYLDQCGSLIRDSQWHGLGVDWSNTALAIRSLADQPLPTGGSRPQKIELCYSQSADMEPAARELLDQLQPDLDAQISLLAYEQSTTEVLARNMVSGLSDSINLLQGGYSVKTPGLRGTLNIRKVATTFAVCVALHLVLTSAAGFWFDWRTDAIKADARTQYQQWFPQAQRVFDPRRQLQSKLVAGDGADGELLLAYIGAVATGWQQQGDGLRLQAMDYEGQSGSMTLQLAAPTAETMAALQRQLQSRGLRSELKSVSQRGELVTGRLVLAGVQ